MPIQTLTKYDGNTAKISTTATDENGGPVDGGMATLTVLDFDGLTTLLDGVSMTEVGATGVYEYTLADDFGQVDRKYPATVKVVKGSQQAEDDFEIQVVDP